MKKQPNLRQSLSEVLLKPLPVSTPPIIKDQEDPAKSTPWPIFCSALRTEYREATEIHGQSGLVHPIAGLGIDEKEKRLIVISADHNPRVAALMRMDVQASLPDFKVLTARPLAVDLPFLVRQTFYDGRNLSISKVFQFLEKLSKHDTQEVKKEDFADAMTGYFTRIGRSDIPAKTHLHNLIEQLSLATWPSMELDGKISLLDLATRFFDGFTTIDNMSSDRENGLCPIPTYEFTEHDWELFLSGKSVDDVTQRLQEMEVYQYFFPARDQLALGLIDRGANNADQLSCGLATAERDGHLINPNSILDNAADVHEIIEEFKRTGIVSEGEISWDLTAEGKSIRNSVRFRPSEGLVSRISKILAFRVDISLDKLLGK